MAQKAYVLKNYTVEDFGNSRQHWDAVQLDDGKMILANSNAVNLYDGVEWSYIHVPKGQTVYSLAKSAKGRVYTGGEGDIGYLYSDSLNQMKFQSLLPKLDSASQNFLYVRGTYFLENKVYFSSKSQVMMYDENLDSVYVYKPETDIVNSFLVDDEIIMQTEKGLYKITNLQKIPINTSSEFSNDKIYGVLPIAGNLLIYFRNKGLQLFNGFTLESFSKETEDYLTTHLGYRMVRLNANQIAVATLTGGIVIVDINGELNQIITKKDGLNDDYVYGLFVNEQGLLWAMLDDGISVIDPSQNFNIYDDSDGIEGLVSGIFKIDDTVYAISNKGFYSKSGRLSFKKINTTPIQVYNSIAISNRIISATYDGLLEIYNNEVRKVSSVVYEKILKISETDFLGWTDNKLFKIELKDNELKEILFVSEFSFPMRWNKLNNNLYAYIGNGKILWLDITNKEKELITVPGIIKDIYTLSNFDEKVIIGSPEGIFEISNTDIKKIEIDYFKELKNVTLIETCEKDTWLRSGAKLYNIRKVGDNLVSESDTYNNIGYSEGVYSIFCSENEVWFGLENKVISIDKDYTHNKSPFQTNITRLVINNDSLIYAGFNDASRDIKLNYSKDRLRFNYAAANFYRPEVNTYSYKLVGFDNDWSNWSVETQKDYTNIPEGSYTFLVKSRDLFNQEGATDEFVFTILPPWYRTWWAYTLYLITFFGLLYLGYRIRINQILQVQRVRNRIADDLHDDLSGTLIGISNFAKAISSASHEKNKTRFLGLIEKSADEAKEKISDIVWTINPDHDDWLAFVTKCRRYASDIFEAQEIDYLLEMDETIPGDLNMELRKNLWLIFKEILTNITKHSKADYVLIRFKIEPKKLEILIRDNGKGFNQEKIVKGNGINSIKKRINAINGRAEVISEVDQGTSWNIFISI
ncbi:MAG: triple tyrosine motif-containing protein [Balneola sp.]